MQMPARLPSLELLRGFEAAARHLSFTKAAQELHVTQSAVSRQVKTIEDQLGVRLFRRMNRALLLTEEGQALARAVATALTGISEAVARLPALAEDRPITVTTSVGFAALWLVPRLARLRAMHPDIDVRIAASNEIIDLQRERMDVAIRFCEPQAAPRGALPLIGEDVFPVASPRLVRDRAHPLRTPGDLAHHVLLHFDNPMGDLPWLAWPEWLVALKVPGLEPAGKLLFNHYDQLVRAAIDGEGVGLGRGPLVERFLKNGELVAPFQDRVTATRRYFVIVAPAAAGQRRVKQFVEWLAVEVKTA
jgi:LysR family transcriptional regulator, glycine cleavage system transcriptional activator